MNKRILLIILFLISFVAVFDLFHHGLPITHDGQDHVARIASFYANLQDGVIVPRWAPNLNWGYGHPILEFLYPFPSYLTSLFHSLGFSLIDGIKIVFGIGMVFSGIAMFLWLSEFLSLQAAFIGGLLYVFAPYRFVDVYVRGDIGENLSFTFMPLTLFFMYKLYKSSKHTYIFGGAISFAFLILSHNAISLMYLPFIAFYAIYLTLLSKYKKNFLLSVFYLMLLGFGLSAFFWLPGLLEGKYTLRNIVTKGVYKDRFVSLSSLFYGPWSYGITGQFTTQLGVVNWLMILASLPLGIIFFIKNDKNFLLIAGLFIYTICSLFLMLPFSVFIWQRILLLQNFQFPWRFLAISVFTTAVLGGFIISFVPKKLSFFTCLILIIAILFFNKDYWRAKGYLQKPEKYFTGIYDATTDTGESAPIWSVRFMEHRFKAPLEVIGGAASIKQNQRASTRHVYTVEVLRKTQFLENTLYFPGWEILIDGKKIPIEYQDGHHRGIMTFFVEQGKHTIEVRYKETKLRLIADIISIISFLILVIVTLRVKQRV